jgi:hypothetical protein
MSKTQGSILLWLKAYSKIDGESLKAVFYVKIYNLWLLLLVYFMLHYFFFLEENYHSNHVNVILKIKVSWVPVAHAYNPSYWGGRDQENLGSVNQAQKAKIACSPSYADCTPKTNAVILLDMGHTLRGKCTRGIETGKET